MSFSQNQQSATDSNPLSFDLSAPAPAAATTAEQPAPADTARKGGLIGILIALGALLLKFKAVFGLLKFSKFLTTGASMLLSIGVYATIWGWKFATGFVLLIFVHEMGHVLAAWWKKLPVSAPMFIPFMGAFITLKQHPQDALTEAQIGYGGPALGAVGCTAAWGCYYLTDNPLFLAVASVSMMINLFNLMPVSPLDGGRIVTAISPRLWLLGLVGMGIWFFYSHNPIILLIVIIGAVRLVAQWKTMKTNDYFKVAPQARIIMTLLYIGLVLYLGFGHTYTHHLVMDLVKGHNLSSELAF